MEEIKIFLELAKDIVGTVTFFLAVIVAGWAIFRLPTVIEALKEFRNARSPIWDLRQSVEQLISTDISGQLTTLNEQISVAQQVLANLQNSVGDLSDEAAITSDIQTERADINGENTNNRREVMRLWKDIQIHVEEIASDPRIDGRTRAKYSRLDRRSYKKLLNELFENGYLPGGKAEWFEALEIRNRYKANRAHVTDADLDKLRGLRTVLLERKLNLPEQE